MLNEKDRNKAENAVMEFRDKLQTKILSEIYLTAKKGDVFVKGGMAMRVVCNSTRYTKDIDLASSPNAVKRRVCDGIERSIRKSVVDVEMQKAIVTKPKNTETTVRWKINGEMPATNAKMQLTVELSRRGLPPENCLITAHYVPPKQYSMGPIVVESYNAGALLVSKIDALLSPLRTAPRDLYDIFILIKLGTGCPVGLLSRHTEGVLEAGLNDTWRKVESITWDRFRTEVLPFLPVKAADRITEETFTEMQLTVAQSLQKWLTDAIRNVRDNKGINLSEGGCGSYPSDGPAR